MTKNSFVAEVALKDLLKFEVLNWSRHRYKPKIKSNWREGFFVRKVCKAVPYLKIRRKGNFDIWKFELENGSLINVRNEEIIPRVKLI